MGLTFRSGNGRSHCFQRVLTRRSRSFDLPLQSFAPGNDFPASRFARLLPMPVAASAPTRSLRRRRGTSDPTALPAAIRWVVESQIAAKLRRNRWPYKVPAPQRSDRRCCQFLPLATAGLLVCSATGCSKHQNGVQGDGAAGWLVPAVPCSVQRWLDRPPGGAAPAPAGSGRVHRLSRQHRLALHRCAVAAAVPVGPGR